jgi:Rieske Fe-S protein
MDASRREFIRRMVAASALISVGAIAVWDLVEGVGPGGRQQAVSVLQASKTQQTQQTQRATASSTETQSSTQAVPAGYVFVTGIDALAGKSSAYFNHPTDGLSMLLNLSGQWKAFNATCTHAPCTVNYSSSQIQCPCHGAVFDPSNGNVLAGPAPTRLPEYGVLIQGTDLYVSTGIVN